VAGVECRDRNQVQIGRSHDVRSSIQMTEKAPLPTVMSRDGECRITEFFARHGGPGRIGEQEGDEELHTRGWSEVYAADGHRLRCEWSRTGDKTLMNFAEISPSEIATETPKGGAAVNV
jgi:hypothetical protein